MRVIMILARSSREDMRDYISAQLESCFNMAGMKTVFSGQYGGWDPNPTPISPPINPSNTLSPIKSIIISLL